MLTKTDLLKELAGVGVWAVVFRFTWGINPWTIAVMAVIITVLVVCNVMLWRNEAGMRELARRGYVKGQPMIWVSSWGIVRDVTYVAPSYTCHIVKLRNVEMHVPDEELRVVPVDVKL